jgi:hypothetical protein
MEWYVLLPHKLSECKAIIDNTARTDVSLGLYGTGSSYPSFREINDRTCEVTIRLSEANLSQAQIEGLYYGTMMVTAVCQGKLKLSARDENTFLEAKIKYCPAYKFKYILLFLIILLALSLYIPIICFFFPIITLGFMLCTVMARIIFISYRGTISNIINEIINQCS